MSLTKNSGIEFLVRTPKKEKLGEIRLLFPSAYPQDSLKEDFNKLIHQTKKGARKSSVIATAMTPFALAFDVSEGRPAFIGLWWRQGGQVCRARCTAAQRQAGYMLRARPI